MTQRLGGLQGGARSASISPDTIAQNPANPQTLNRYSYCLNNPLKYTDPSGHVVDFQYEDLADQYLTEGSFNGMSTMVEDWLSLRSAWFTLSTVDKVLTDDMESSSAAFTILYGVLGPNAGAQTDVTTHSRDSLSGIDKATSINITFNSLYSHSSTTLIGELAHESYHSLVRSQCNLNDTWVEEAFAAGFGWNIEAKLGSPISHHYGEGGYQAIKNVTPLMTSIQISNLISGLNSDVIWNSGSYSTLSKMPVDMIGIGLSGDEQFGVLYSTLWVYWPN